MNKNLLNFIVDDSLLKRIEDFRFKNRFATRASAIKWLLDYALKQKPSMKNLEREIEEEPEVDPPSEPAILPAATNPAVLASSPGVGLPSADFSPKAVAEPVASNPASLSAAKPEASATPSRASMIQTLRDQGYEVGETVLHPDGQERILVRSPHGSAWVNTAQELQDLAAARGTLAALSAKRAAGR